MTLEGAVVDCGYFQVGVSGLFLLDVVQEAALVVVVHPAEDARREPGQHQQHQRAFHVRHMVRHNCLWEWRLVKLVQFNAVTCPK